MEMAWVVLGLLLRWGHILPAAILVGAAIYARLAVGPTMESLPEEQRKDFQDELARRWSMVVGICAGLLLLTGLVNAGMNMTQFRFQIPALYHTLVFLKLVLALAVLYIASLLNGSSDAAKEFRASSGKFWLTINCWLAVALVLIGGGMKLAEREKKTDGPTPVVSPESPPAPSS